MIWEKTPQKGMSLREHKTYKSYFHTKYIYEHCIKRLKDLICLRPFMQNAVRINETRIKDFTRFKFEHTIYILR